ncbi:MAG TPA: four helix bundle protein [Thermoanaerobaculia bacterium]|nr:four helix bundle protein [Thermoanaerobaculia bacterium]
MAMPTFEELDAFQYAVDLTVAIYRATSEFPKDERYELRRQLRRASISVVSNIAEGQGRLTNGEWRQFLSQARGSLFEIQAQLIVALRLELLDEARHRRLRSAVIKVAKPLAGLIDYVRRRGA